MYAAQIVATALNEISGYTSAYASYEQGQSTKRAAEFNAKMAEYNAQQARDAATVKAELSARDTARKLGTMRQGYAKSGVDISEGTPLAVLMESASEGAKDIVRIKAGGETQAWAFMEEAKLQKMQGEQAERAGYLSAFTTILGTESKSASIWAGGGMGGSFGGGG